MTRDEEARWIADGVRRAYDESGVMWPPTECGPTPLHRLIGEYPFPTIHVELDGLNHAAVSAYLGRSNQRLASLPDPDPKLAGFIHATDRSARIFVCRGDFLPRRRFSAAHELGHLVLHRKSGQGGDLSHGDAKIADSGDPAEDAMERQANRFAAEILMPEVTCRVAHERYSRRYGPSTRFLVHHLASELLVSREAVAWRLYELKLAPRPGGRSDDDSDRP